MCCGMRLCTTAIGRWAVALLIENAGIPVPGETILLMASFLAYSQHELQLSWIILVATIAATIGDNLGFALGYYGGRPLLVRYQSIFRIRPSTLQRGEKLFDRLRSGNDLLCAICVRHADCRRTTGGLLRMSVEEISGLQFSGCRAVGERDLRRWISVRAPLASAGEHHQDDSTWPLRLWWFWLEFGSGGGAKRATLP